MLSQHFPLLFVGVRLVLACFLEFLISKNRHTPEQVVPSVGHDLPGQVEAHGLQQPLPGNFVEPIELQHKGHQVDGGQTVLHSPVLPVQPEEVKFEGQHLGTARISINAFSVRGQQLKSLGVGVKFVSLARFIKSDVAHLEVAGY